VINLFILFVNRKARCVSFADPQFHTMLHKPRSGEACITELNNQTCIVSDVDNMKYQFVFCSEKGTEAPDNKFGIFPTSAGGFHLYRKCTLAVGRVGFRRRKVCMHIQRQNPTFSDSQKKHIYKKCTHKNHNHVCCKNRAKRCFLVEFLCKRVRCKE
jgi:hypothetical protein